MKIAEGKKTREGKNEGMEREKRRLEREKK